MAFGLFEKKICCICGKKAGLPSRQKIKTKEYLCGDCTDKCSRDLSDDDFKKMTPEAVKEHMAYMEVNERVYNEKFEETGRIAQGFLGLDSILSYDLNHGWWVRSDSPSHDLYGIGSVRDCRFDMETSSLPDEEREDEEEPDFLDGILDFIFSEDDLKRCPPGRKIDKMFVDIQVGHPWVSKVRIYTMDEVTPEQEDIRRGYETAEEILNFFRDHRGDKVDPVGQADT